MWQHRNRGNATSFDVAWENMEPSPYEHWITPTLAGAQHVPDAAEVAALVDDLVDARWITRWPSGPYDEAMPSFYATFPGSFADSEVRAGDPRCDLSRAVGSVIQASHCRSITVMVTDTLLIAPTTEAQNTSVACSDCGAQLLPGAEPRMSRRVPDTCQNCETRVDLSVFSHLPVFRFALILEPWFSPASPKVAVHPDLLLLLGRRTGCQFKEAGQHAKQVGK
jgi:hypothetical protein